MSRLKFLGACLAATVFVLSSREPMAQGLLSASPQARDDIMSPDPLGPLQRFGDWSRGSETGSARTERAPLSQPQQADAVGSGHSQPARPPNPAAKARQAAVRPTARRHDWQRAAAGSGSMLSLAPINRQRLSSRQFCFPSSTIHLQQNERDVCNGGAPAVKSRFEELLGE